MASKTFNLRYHTAAAIVILGILYLVSIYMLTTQRDFESTKFAMQSTFRYVNTQFTEFQKVDAASQVKSLSKATAKTEQIARNLLTERGRPMVECLQRYTDEQRLSGIIVLDANGQLVAEYNKDRFGFAALKYELLKPSVMDTAVYKEKVYADRMVLSDGSYIDLAVCARLDDEGVVCTYYHTTAEYASNYNMSLQTLFSGYSMQTSGTIIITDGNKILASNDGGLIGTKVDNNDIVVALKENAFKHELVHVKDEKGRDFYGGVDRGRNFYIYIYFSEAQVFDTRLQKLGYALLFYLIAVGIFLAFRARTEKKYLAQQRELDEEYKEQLREAARVARNANKAKTEFLQRMSHDIRTPINGIRGLVEIGNYYADDLQKQKECREKIWQSSGFLLDLINEVLDMGKLSSGEVTLEEVPFDLDELQAEVKEIIAQQAKEKGIEIFVKKCEVQHKLLLGSPVHVKRIFLNVLSNVVKYNKDNGKIYLSTVETGCENGVVTFEFIVEDTGIGISKRFLPHVFEAFAQDGDVARSSYEGTGLGMPIVKSLVEKMGGSVEVESEKGIGSIFTLHIPFKLAEQSVEKKQSEKLAPDAARGMHVLLAEDNDLNLEIAQFFLQNAGVTYVAARNGREAVEKFAEAAPGTFDALLMDVMMPYMNGLEATKQIRALEREDAKTVPIIAMTANAFVEDKKQALEAGMTNYLTKPLESTALIKMLARFAKKK